MGRTVLLETSGALPIGQVPPGVHRIMDLKAPGSGECAQNLWQNLEHLTPRDELKIVMADRKDYVWAREVVLERGLDRLCHAVLFSPAAGLLAADELSAWILEDELPVRLNLQLHRIIWPERDRGV